MQVELNHVAHVGERTPALRTAVASPGERMPGSSESSLSQPYEDARSRAYTPETGSLLDFDTPFASPVSPQRGPWRPTPSPLSEDTTHDGGPISGPPHGEETRAQQADPWAMLENGAIGAHLLLCNPKQQIILVLCIEIPCGASWLKLQAMDVPQPHLSTVHLQLRAF